MMTTQNCPNCGLTHDVSVFASGQRVACGCGIHFEVRRNLASVVQVPSGVALPSQLLGEGSVAPTLKNVPAVSRDDEEAPTLVPHPSSKPARAQAASAENEAPRDYGTMRPETPPETPEVSAPTVLGTAKPELPGFELQELLGRGGMGEVWRARQQSLGRMVAVKLLPPRLAKDREFVTRFEKEATALASLNHPNIVQIIDRGVVGEHYYFAMEYVEGRSLREAIGPGRVTPQQALRIILQVSRAIECAHEKGIVHRDLKPENILLDGRDHVKVADFGLAGIQGPDSKLQLTATSVAMGTLNYMAPEQRRDAKHVDGRADLFSLGVMLYEVLTGELPLGRFKLPSVRVPGLDARVDTVVARLLENEPDARYASAAEVCAELEALVTHSSAPGLALVDAGTARQESPAKKQVSATQRRLRSGWRRVRTGLTVVGGLVVAGLLVRAVVGPVDVHLGGDKVIIGTSGVSVKPGSKPWPANTDGELLVAATFVERPGTTSKLDLTFTPGEEKMNARSGTWKLVDGELRAWQGGSESDGKLVPRAYIAQRYFSSDDFSAEVLMDVKPLGPEYPVEQDAQHYGELAFRIKDVQVSAFAIPGVGMRLSWRYMTDGGEEVVGNSARDQDDLVEDEMPVPTTGPFLVRIQLKKGKKGVEVEATLNGKRFAHKVLPGLEGKVAKVALGCRNLACTFDDLKVRGLPMPQPKRKVAEQQD